MGVVRLRGNEGMETANENGLGARCGVKPRKHTAETMKHLSSRIWEGGA